MVVHFGSRNEWLQKREQTQTLIKKIFSEMEKGSRWFKQLINIEVSNFMAKKRDDYKGNANKNEEIWQN